MRTYFRENHEVVSEKKKTTQNVSSDPNEK